MPEKPDTPNSVQHEECQMLISIGLLMREDIDVVSRLCGTSASETICNALSIGLPELAHQRNALCVARRFDARD